jgi:RHS repeat-associated protein
VQETHYGPWGEVLEGLGQSGDWRFLYQAKEYIDGLGYDFHSRTYDPYSGRFLQLDGANQFASGYTGMGNVPTMGVDPDGQWVQQAIGAVLGAYSGYQIGKMNGATGWKMAGYIAGGAAIGAISGGLSNSISAGGGFLANTNAIVVGSMANSFGMDALSGGKTPFVISFGAASYNATEGEWGYLGKEGNSKMENFGYAMGAMANVQDLVAGFNGVKVDVTARKEIAGHSEINGCYGDQCIAISVGPLDEIQLPDGTSQMRWEKQYGKMTLRGKSARGKNVNFIENGDPVFTKTLNNVNGSILTKMTDRLMRGQNLIGNSNLKYGFMYGCVNYTSRALFGAGVLNFNALLPLTSPVLLNAELALRNYGMLSSYFFTR